MWHLSPEFISRVVGVDGEEAGTRREGRIRIRPAVVQNWKWNTLECVWNALKWKWARLSRPPVGSIHKEPQLVWTWSSGRTARGRVNRLRQWCSCLSEGSATPIPRISEASSCAFNCNDSPTSHSEDPRAPTLHPLHCCVGVLSSAPPPLSSSNYKAVYTD